METPNAQFGELNGNHSGDSKRKQRRRSNVLIIGYAICLSTNTAPPGHSKGESTGTYAFNTGYYGLSILPPEFQKIMDNILHPTKNTLVFLGDILLVTKANKESHMRKVEEILAVLDRAGIRSKIEKGRLAKRETEWLGYILSAAGIKPIDEKVQAIMDRLRPQNLKDLRYFLGFIPGLAHLCAPLRPLICKDNEWKCDKEQEKAFEQFKDAIKKITEIKHSQRDVPTRIICDASQEGLGAVLQQKQNTEWETTHYASRFQTEFEKKLY